MNNLELQQRQKQKRQKIYSSRADKEGETRSKKKRIRKLDENLKEFEKSTKRIIQYIIGHHNRSIYSVGIGKNEREKMISQRFEINCDQL